MLYEPILIFVCMKETGIDLFISHAQVLQTSAYRKWGVK